MIIIGITLVFTAILITVLRFRRLITQGDPTDIAHFQYQAEVLSKEEASRKIANEIIKQPIKKERRDIILFWLSIVSGIIGIILIVAGLF